MSTLQGNEGIRYQLLFLVSMTTTPTPRKLFRGLRRRAFRTPTSALSPAIPGLGPVVAAGWLTATAVGAAAGAATGGIVGALTEAGVSKDDASLYAEGVRRGGTLVSARVPE
jgi:hypothetical protein